MIKSSTLIGKYSLLTEKRPVIASTSIMNLRSDKMNPILSIWTQPKNTLREMIDHKSRSYALIIVLLASLSSGIMTFADSGFLENFPLALILAISIGSLLLLSIPAWYLNALLYTWIGKLLGGTGNWRKMCQVVATGMIPTIWTMPIGLIAVSIYGKTLFETPPGEFGLTNMSLGFYMLHTLILLGVAIYSTVIISKGIGLVHNFSSWRGFGTIMIFAGILFLLFIVIFIIVVTVAIAVF